MGAFTTKKFCGYKRCFCFSSLSLFCIISASDVNSESFNPKGKIKYVNDEKIIIKMSCTQNFKTNPLKNVLC